MTSTVLLTGATGFVGRQILKALTEQSSKVRLVVRDEKQGQIEQADQIESVLVTPDIFLETSRKLKEICNGVDTFIHAAWYAEPGKYLQSPKNIDCLSGTLALAKACVQAGVRRFIGIGTCFEYDLSIGYLSIDAPLKPTTPYAASKAATFLALSQYLAAAGVEFVWCRLFYLYGEGEDERRLVPYLRKRLAQGEIAELTSGTQVRDFLDVQEAGRLIAEIAQGKQQGPINVCSGQPITVRQLAEQIADEYGRRDLLHFGTRPDNLVDPPCVVGIKADSK
ncbi:MAG: NAD-dependent epimerase/dehydratase family protein [Candidatus Electronema sp. V4]|uniref:NAD-dependent epimerase/dehydratase family protein n=1 Tax=Candidatus Electronema sp. V4 TaxID=3454756 RepID=UPI0040553A65